MIQVLEKQHLTLVEEVQGMPLQPGKVLVLPKGKQGVEEKVGHLGVGYSWEPAAPGDAEEEAVCFGCHACVFAAPPREGAAGSELPSLVNFLYSFGLLLPGEVEGFLFLNIAEGLN